MRTRPSIPVLCLALCLVAFSGALRACRVRARATPSAISRSAASRATYLSTSRRATTVRRPSRWWSTSTGWSSNADQQRALSGMRPLSDAEGFLVVYPEGWKNAWNANICCGNGELDDVGFIRAVVAAVSAEGNRRPAPDLRHRSVERRRHESASGVRSGRSLRRRRAHGISARLASPASGASRRARSRPDGDGAHRHPGALRRWRVRIGRRTFDYWREMDGCGAGVPEWSTSAARAAASTTRDARTASRSVSAA